MMVVFESDVLQAGEKDQSVLFHIVSFRGEQHTSNGVPSYVVRVDDDKNSDCDMLIPFIDCLL